MQIGQVVNFSDQFLDDIGAGKTPLAHATGTIIEIDNGIASVHWSSARIPRHNHVRILVAVVS